MAIHLMKISGRMPITPMITDPGIIGMRLRFRLYRIPLYRSDDLHTRVHTGPRIDIIIPMGAQVRIATVKTRIGRDWIRSRVHNDRWWIDRYAFSRVRAVIRFERPLEKVEYETWDGNGGSEDSFLTH